MGNDSFFSESNMEKEKLTGLNSKYNFRLERKEGLKRISYPAGLICIAAAIWDPDAELGFDLQYIGYHENLDSFKQIDFEDYSYTIRKFLFIPSNSSEEAELIIQDLKAKHTIERTFR